jgi:nucleoside phosphorylase
MRPQSRNEFETAIICALPLEFDAVETLFDEHYDGFRPAYGKQLGDANWYRTGRVDRHNIVLTCLPAMGKGSAASVASSLKVSFPKITLAFLVGICGGVPFPSERTEIILGDVIISDRVVEYDFGRQYPDGFQRKGVVKETLGPANRHIRTFLSALQTNRLHDQLQDDLLKHLQCLQQQLNGRWQYPDTVQDQLFQTSYRHKHYHLHPDTACLCMDCQSISDPVCDKALKIDCRKLGCMGRLITRRRLSADRPNPQVHFGSLASADTVMKSGEHRNQLAETEKVIGFEMEGAGIWDNLPCIIIKGVCDYADSHKNKVWQNYAAATAASALKAFLKCWAGTAMEGE